MECNQSDPNLSNQSTVDNRPTITDMAVDKVQCTVMIGLTHVTLEWTGVFRVSSYLTLQSSAFHTEASDKLNYVPAME